MFEFSEVDRRAMLARMLVLTGAAATSGFSVEALAKAAKQDRPYLDPKVFALLSTIADTLVPRTDTPGAVDVRVPALLDHMLVNWASGERRYEITQAMLTIDSKAQTTFQRPFVELAATERSKLLNEHDRQSLKVLPAKGGRGGAAELMAGPNYADRGYAKLKELIVLLFYMSEPALTQELSYVHAPGEWKPSIPVTPDTRPMGGTMF